MDFRSHIDIDGKAVTISMNKVAQVEGWRFYQSGISPGSTRLSISHDPWGTGITYTGYALLFIGMAGFFFQRNTAWRALLRASKKAVAAAMLLATLSASAGNADTLPVMQRPLAADMGKVYVYWNDRICPMQTMARDVTLKLYGSESERGLSAEQVLSGWLFYFDTWERDYRSSHTGMPANTKQQKQLDERLALINWLGTGEAFKIYPYRTADGHTEWLSLTGKRPSKMSLEQWEFMQTTMPRIKKLLLEGRNIEADKTIATLIDGQILYAGRENLPSAAQIQAERAYNRYASLLAPAILSLLIGMLYLYVAIKGCQPGRLLTMGLNVAVFMILCYIASILGLLWWIGGHMPLSNGPEMMLFMSLVALICALASRNSMLRGALYDRCSDDIVCRCDGRPFAPDWHAHAGAGEPAAVNPRDAGHDLVCLFPYYGHTGRCRPGVEVAADGRLALPHKPHHTRTGSLPSCRRHIRRSHLGKPVVGPVLGLGPQRDLRPGDAHHLFSAPALAQSSSQGVQKAQSTSVVPARCCIISPLYLFRSQLFLIGITLLRIN